jgi:hypothetical protein
MKPEHEAQTAQENDRSNSRASLVWEVFLFQLKLVADGFRDVILVPISLVSALMGLIIGGDQPDRYFRQVLSLGRRSEIWINLFAHRKHRGTSDAMIEPLRERVMSEAQNNAWVQRAGKGINRTLDTVNDHVDTVRVSKKPEERDPDNLSTKD